MNRPVLTSALAEAEFRAWYWLKTELAAFCRAEGLSASGSKQELAADIAPHLGSWPLPARAPRRHRAARMPGTFHTDTIIGEGWRCTQALRSFFETQCGKNFGFNGPLRTFIATGRGHTLAEALTHYRQSLAAEPRPIAEQFEYNTHMRAFKAANPSGTHAAAVSAWWHKRGKRDGG